LPVRLQFPVADGDRCETQFGRPSVNARPQLEVLSVARRRCRTGTFIIHGSLKCLDQSVGGLAYNFGITPVH